MPAYLMIIAFAGLIGTSIFDNMNEFSITDEFPGTNVEEIFMDWITTDTEIADCDEIHDGNDPRVIVVGVAANQSAAQDPSQTTAGAIADNEDSKQIIRLDPVLISAKTPRT